MDFDCERCADTGIAADRHGNPELCDHLPPLDRVPVTPFREAVERMIAHQEHNASEIARMLGFTQDRKGQPGYGDVTGMRRAVGIAPYSEHNGKVYRRTSIPYEQAVEFARRLHLDPVDVGV